MEKIKEESYIVTKSELLKICCALFDAGFSNEKQYPNISKEQKEMASKIHDLLNNK